MNKLERFLIDYEAFSKFEAKVIEQGYESIREYWLTVVMGDVEPHALLGAVNYYDLTDEGKRYWQNLHNKWIKYLIKIEDD